MLTDTSASPYALATSVAPGAVTLADGPWLRLHERTADVTVRAIGAQLHDPSVGHAYENFRIAAGDTAGEHAGPPFMDGDLYKWLEAAAALQAGHHDDDRAAWIAEAVDVIGRAQRADGYVHTQTLIANRSRRLARAGTGAEPEEPHEDRLNFETYNLGHLMTAGVVLHRATGDDSLLALGRKAADYIHHLWRDRTDLLARSAICPSHYMGVVELYRATRDERYLALAEALLDIRDRVEGGGDDNQDRVPLREQRVIAGHAVRANYLYAGAADVVAETGDAELLAVLEGLWRDLVATKLSITGGCGALYDGASPDGFPDQPQITRVHQAYGRPYQLPSTTAHNESCATPSRRRSAWTAARTSTRTRCARWPGCPTTCGAPATRRSTRCRPRLRRTNGCARSGCRASAALRTSPGSSPNCPICCARRPPTGSRCTSTSRAT